ncbi:MAG TPA: hypothetical protein VNO13_01260 [Candidatus Udaeobacter sp.]|nr:hypothetical protein [Candidatus Udaeobacter sp.]
MQPVELPVWRRASPQVLGMLREQKLEQPLERKQALRPELRRVTRLGRISQPERPPRAVLWL